MPEAIKKYKFYGFIIKQKKFNMDWKKIKAIIY